MKIPGWIHIIIAGILYGYSVYMESKTDSNLILFKYFAIAFLIWGVFRLSVDFMTKDKEQKKTKNIGKEYNREYYGSLKKEQEKKEFREEEIKKNQVQELSQHNNAKNNLDNNLNNNTNNNFKDNLNNRINNHQNNNNRTKQHIRPHLYKTHQHTQQQKHPSHPYARVVRCPRCHNLVSSKARICPYCSYRLRL